MAELEGRRSFPTASPQEYESLHVHLSPDKSHAFAWHDDDDFVAWLPDEKVGAAHGKF